MKKSIEAAAALIQKDNKYLLAQRKKDDFYGSLWEFPGGAREDGEKIEEAVEREIAEELNLKIKAHHIIGEFFDENERLKIKIFLISCSIEKGSCKRSDCQDFGFFALKEIEKLSLAPADKKIFNYIKKSKNERKIT